jgi:hypothetical protein
VWFQTHPLGRAVVRMGLPGLQAGWLPAGRVDLIVLHQ